MIPESLHIDDFGARPDDYTDTAGALDAAVEECKRRQIRCIRFGIGRYRFTSQPSPIKAGVTLKGTNRPETMLVRAFSGCDDEHSCLLVWEGGFCDPTVAATIYGGLGGGVKDMHIIAARGTTGGIGIWLVARPALLPVVSMFTVENVEIYGEDGTWAHSLYVDGARNVSAKPGPGSVLYGIRDVFVKSSQFMHATRVAVVVNRGVAVYLADLGVYQGANGCNDDVLICSGALPQYSTEPTSYGVVVNGLINGTLRVHDARGVVATGVFGGADIQRSSNVVINGERLA